MIFAREEVGEKKIERFYKIKSFGRESWAI